MDNIYVNIIFFFVDLNVCDFDKDYCNWINVWSMLLFFKWYCYKGFILSRNIGLGGDYGIGNGKFGFGLFVFFVEGFLLFYWEMEFLNIVNL